MGMFKRILRQTSHKLLAKLGGHRSSHRLVLNSSSSSSCNTNRGSPTGLRGGRPSARRQTKRLQPSKGTAGNSQSAALNEALLLAAKNYLPPVQFHHVHGPNVQLSPNRFVARRTQSFCQALVFSNRVILPNERVYVKVLEIAKGWSGTIRFGFTSVDPATLRYQMPKHACPDMTNAGHTWARALADEVVRRNSVIHFSYNSNGFIHYGINNQDCGVFNANVKTSQHLWFIVDIYGLTAAVELIDPRLHNNSTSELNFSRLDDELRMDSRTMYKSAGPMDGLLAGTAFAVRSSKKKKKRVKSNGVGSRSRQSALLYGQWSPENLMNGFNHHHLPAPPLLPNLSSIILPPSQQNIYSPMPSVATVESSGRPTVAAAMSRRNEPHDYYQIMTNIQNRLPMVANGMAYDNSIGSNVSTSSGGSALAARFPNHENNVGGSAGDEEICQQLDGFQISDEQHQQSTIQTPKSNTTAGTSSSPVAATRRRPQTTNNLVQTNSKRTNPEPSKDYQSKIAHPGATSKTSSAPTAATSKSSAGSKSRARHSTTSGPKTVQQTSRDMNNNSPPSKDCPICFERPINCVLYQCGHMCTCYECGVKQWKTQSRTCPICRTVIKDVIKTYMS